MQDNARQHISAATLDYFRQHHIQVLTGWPPYSLDLNIIEVIWAIMKRRVQNRSPQTIRDLKAIIQEDWDSLGWQTIAGLVDSMPRRLQQVIRNEGRTIYSLD
jgi:transposase